MLMEIDRNYGSDIDGNRGTTVRDYELDNDDTSAVRQEIFDILKERDYDYSDSVAITLICPITEQDIQFDVEISSYITKREFNLAQEEYNEIDK